MKNSEKTLDMIVNLCKSRGYVYAGSEIYGGLANSWVNWNSCSLIHFIHIFLTLLHMIK